MIASDYVRQTKFDLCLLTWLRLVAGAIQSILRSCQHSLLHLSTVTHFYPLTCKICTCSAAL